jgi:hypothetical protein
LFCEKTVWKEQTPGWDVDEWEYLIDEARGVCLNTWAEGPPPLVTKNHLEQRRLNFPVERVPCAALIGIFCLRSASCD